MNKSAPLCLLFDNGSLRPEATLGLRAIARGLQTALGTEARAVSLLHSSAIDSRELGGTPAHLLEPALAAALRDGAEDVVLLPLFFGPSAALTEYVPGRLRRLRQKFPSARLRLGRWLVDPAEEDMRIASILADNVRAVMRDAGLARPRVALVDHGSPQRAVTVVRDFLGGRLRGLLAPEIDRLEVASMERRAGSEYDFNEPLLAALLRRGEFASGDVVVALQFLASGRHAGAGGDVMTICAEAEKARPGLRTHPTEPVGCDPRLIEVLADRHREAREMAPVV